MKNAEAWKQIWSILQWIVLIGGAVGAIYTVLFKWHKIRIQAMQIFESMIGTKQIKNDIKMMSEQMNKVSQQMNQITNQLMPNGGSSIFDKVNQVLAKQQMTASRQRAVAFESMQPSFEASPAGRVTWLNRALCLLVGRLPDELTGHGWVNVVAPEDREHVTELWSAAMDEKRDFDETFKLVGSDGHRITVAFKAIRMTDDAGNVIGYFGTIQRQS